MGYTPLLRSLSVPGSTHIASLQLACKTHKAAGNVSLQDLHAFSNTRLGAGLSSRFDIILQHK